MTYDEAAELLGEDGVQRAQEFVASLPPMTAHQADAVARILLGADRGRADDTGVRAVDAA